MDLCASKAYARVFVNSSSRTAKANAWQLMERLDVQARIKELIEARAKRVDDSADRVVEEIKKIAYSKLSDIFAFDGNYLALKNFDDIPDDALSYIESIDIVDVGYGKDKQEVIKVKFHNKVKALEMLSRHHGLFNDKLKLSGKLKTIEEVIREAKKSEAPYEGLYDESGEAEEE